MTIDGFGLELVRTFVQACTVVWHGNPAVMVARKAIRIAHVADACTHEMQSGSDALTKFHRIGKILLATTRGMAY